MKPPPLLPCGLGFVFALAAFAAVFTASPLRAAEPRTVPGLGWKLMPIPAGTFTRGSPATEAGHFDEEGPQTRVTIVQPFWLGQTEVTQGQWRTSMGSDLAKQAQQMAFAPPLLFIGDDLPMHFVSWEEAGAFCRKLTESERAARRVPAGYEYRLPTEAEWEYACRAGTTEATYAGHMEIRGRHNAPVLDAIAWYGGNSSVGYEGTGMSTATWEGKQYPGGDAGPRTVATKRPNAWGLHDMLGNMNEWCGDLYASNLPGGNVRDPRGPDSGAVRVRRGGSWNGYAQFARAAYRYDSKPGYRSANLGFRIALAPAKA
jgi:formylglycine-generating enzyme required for sulfatase activity